jgi:osmotically-inducible protein OsmY
VLALHPTGSWSAWPFSACYDEIRGAGLQNLIWDAEVPSDSIDVKVQDGWATLKGDVSFQFQSDAATTTCRGCMASRA